MPDNVLYYGDNLDILRRYVADESIDLIYLDPPFNSNQAYNVIFEEENGSGSGAQIQAFDDTWHWNMATAALFHETVETGGIRVAEALDAFRNMLGDTDMMAYLANMAPRLVELRRVLKPTGSIYLHCDPTASHYLKVLMDAIFGVEEFRSEIIWKRYSSHGNVSVNYGAIHDVILFYGRTGNVTWNQPYQDYDPSYIERFFRYVEDETGRRYRTQNVLNPNRNRPNLEYEWNGHVRVWKWTRQRMQKLHDEGLLHYSSTGYPQLKQYLDESPGVKVQDIWLDVQPLTHSGAERLGYPTQKPEALLERIIRASSDEGDLVLDPFCGCGTTVVVAQRLGRRWIGIDVTHIAVNLMRFRLRDTFGEEITGEYEVIGEPTDVAGATELAHQDRYQFELWALGLVGARHAGTGRGADRGIDGVLHFHEPAGGSPTREIVLSVKSGHVTPGYVRDLRGVVEREDAAIGVLITLEEPSAKMREEAASAGFWSPAHNAELRFPRIQILTIEELLAGEAIDCPYLRHGTATFRQAPRDRKPEARTGKLIEE